MMFGKRIQALRSERKLSQTKLAEEIGITRQVYGQYELGKSTPSLDVLADIADYFVVSVDYLIGRDEYSVLSYNEKDKCVFLPKELTEDDCETVKDLIASLHRRRLNRRKN